MEYQIGKLRDEIEALASFVDSLLSSHASKILPDTKQDVSCTSSVPASQVLNDLLRRSPANVETVFSKHTHDPRGIPRQNFSCASQDVRFEFTDEDDLNELFNNMDMDNDGFLDLNEFRRAMQSKSIMEQFISSTFPLNQMLSSALPRTNSHNPIEVFRNLTAVEVKSIAHAFSE